MRPIKHLRWWIGGLLFLSTVINYIDRQTLSMLAPFLTQGHEGLNIDDEEDLARAEQLIAEGRAGLVSIGREPYPGEP